MVETELAFLEMEPQRAAAQASGLRQTHLGDAPEVLNAIDVGLALNKLVAAVIHPVMLLVAQVNQAAVAFPAIRVNHAAQRHLALQNGCQDSSGTVWNNLRVNLALTLKQAEDGNLFKSSPPALAAHTATAKKTFINLHLPPQRRLGFAQQGDAFADVTQVKVDRVAVQPGRWAILVASISRQNSRTNSRNLAAEMRERRKYTFRPVIIGFMRCLHELN